MASTILMVMTLFFAVVNLLPIAVIGVIGLATQNIPPGGEIFDAGPGYPAFDPQSWLLYIPAAVMLFLSIWTFNLPMRGEARLGRHFATALTFIMFAASVPLAMAFDDAPNINDWGLYGPLVFLLAWFIFVVRLLLGWLKWLPASWREKVSAEQRWSPVP